VGVGSSGGRTGTLRKARNNQVPTVTEGRESRRRRSPSVAVGLRVGEGRRAGEERRAGEGQARQDKARQDKARPARKVT
jgi:hypothetical protein